MISSYAAWFFAALPIGARETLILLLLRIVPTVGGRLVADRAKNVLREGDEQSDQSERADQTHKHQNSFQRTPPSAVIFPVRTNFLD
jgi:hypothetical protein